MPNIRTTAAARYLGLSKSFLDKARCYGGGPVYLKLGASVFYRTEDLDAWMAARVRTSTWGDGDNDNATHARAA